jgi:hypothetical protein
MIPNSANRVRDFELLKTKVEAVYWWITADLAGV